MRFRTRAALLAIVVAAAAAGCSGGGQLGFFGRQYEYEEDLTLALDGSATLVVNASLPALAALRGLPIDTDPRVRDTSKIRSLYSTPYSEVVRVSTWTRRGRRFVGIRLNVPDIRALPKAAPFSWAHYDLDQHEGQTTFRETIGPPAFKPGTLKNVGWRGDELVAFRLHLPARIREHNSRDVYSNETRGVQRGNILTWEQLLTDRLDGKPIAWDNGAPGVMAVRMDSQSILYRTLWLFGLAFAAAVGVLALLIWITMRRGKKSVVDEPSHR
jgi:hypothetical protein